MSGHAPGRDSNQKEITYVWWALTVYLEYLQSLPRALGVLPYLTKARLDHMECEQEWLQALLGEALVAWLVCLPCSLFSLTRKDPERQPHQPAFQNEDDMNQSSSCLLKDT